MARLNIEDSLWADQRFLQLCVKLQDELLAIGVIVAAWKLAQKYWCPDKQPIPLAVYQNARFSGQLLEVGLACNAAGGVLLKGCEEHFEWWFSGLEQRSEAGKRSAEKRRVKFGSAQPKGGKQDWKSNENRTTVRTPIENNRTRIERPERNRTVSNPLPLPLPLKKEEEDEERVKFSVRSRDIFLKKYGGDVARLEEQLALAQELYKAKPALYRSQTPFLLFFERRVEVDLRDRTRHKGNGSREPQTEPGQPTMTELLMMTREPPKGEAENA